MAGDPPRAWHAKLTAMAMLFSHAESTERMVALPATADGGQKIDPEAARRVCRLWLEALGSRNPVFRSQIFGGSGPLGGSAKVRAAWEGFVAGLIAHAVVERCVALPWARAWSGGVAAA